MRLIPDEEKRKEIEARIEKYDYIGHCIENGMLCCVGADQIRRYFVEYGTECPYCHLTLKKGMCHES